MTEVNKYGDVMIAAEVLYKSIHCGWIIMWRGYPGSHDNRVRKVQVLDFLNFEL